MQKSLSLLVFVILALTLALPAIAADKSWFSTPEGFFAGSRDVITPGEGATRAEAARHGEIHAMGGGPTGPVLLPGDQMVGVVNLSQRVYRCGQQLQANFIVWNDHGPVFIYGRVYRPGYSGYYGGEGSSVSYFSARSSLGPGYFPTGIQGSEVINLLDERVSDRSLDGEYVIDVTLVDATSSRLIQQVFTRYYINQVPGPQMLTIYRASWLPNGIDLVGNFPRGQAVLAYIGTAVPGNVNMFTVVASPDGNTLHLPLFFWSRWEMPLDVVFWVPYFRESGYLPQGLIVPAQLDNTRG